MWDLTTNYVYQRTLLYNSYLIDFFISERTINISGTFRNILRMFLQDQPFRFFNGGFGYIIEV